MNDVDFRRTSVCTGGAEACGHPRKCVTKKQWSAVWLESRYFTDLTEQARPISQGVPDVLVPDIPKLHRPMELVVL